jgi:hypothetical protein
MLKDKTPGVPEEIIIRKVDAIAPVVANPSPAAVASASSADAPVA